MIRKFVMAGAGACLAATVVVSGCSTVVGGSGEADPSGGPRPDTGSFPTTAQNLKTPTKSDYIFIEWLRMGNKLPLPIDVDSAYRVGGSFRGGLPTGPNLHNAFGSEIGKRLAAAELYAISNANASSGGEDARAVTYAIVRMASPEAAAAAVDARAILTTDETTVGSPPPAKTAIPIPGYAKAVGYRQDYGAKYGTSVSSVIPLDRYVLAVRGDFTPDQIKKLADLTANNLRDFRPTPMDTVSTLPLDEFGLARYVLPPTVNPPYRCLPTTFFACSRTSRRRRNCSPTAGSTRSAWATTRSFGPGTPQELDSSAMG